MLIGKRITKVIGKIWLQEYSNPSAKYSDLIPANQLCGKNIVSFISENAITQLKSETDLTKLGSLITIKTEYDWLKFQVKSIIETSELGTVFELADKYECIRFLYYSNFVYHFERKSNGEFEHKPYLYFNFKGQKSDFTLTVRRLILAEEYDEELFKAQLNVGSFRNALCDIEQVQNVLIATRL
jgi:hypothetical protein